MKDSGYNLYVCKKVTKKSVDISLQIKDSVGLIIFYNGVVKVTILEPFDKKIIANLGDEYNIFHRLILLMKLDTQTYYNIRMIIGYEIQ